MSSQALSISDVQREFTRLPDQFEKEEDLDAVTVTRYGKPVMAILPFSTYKLMLEAIESMLETLEVLQDEELMAAFRQGVKELSEGKGEPLDEVLKELGLE
jgi:PHD/YefM family antitoxin component YafN of YafNO toxin-antitoxin module